MTNNETENPCRYCGAKDMRIRLAEALESGRYSEQPVEERHSHMKLRDTHDRYSITGVAVDVLAPFIWIKNREEWHAFDHERIPQEWQKEGLRHQVEDMSEDDFQEIQSGGTGESEICPERTACALGLHTNHEHPEVLEVRSSLLSPTRREEAGIPRNQQKNHPLNILSFRGAATLLREEPNILTGDCECNQEGREQ